MYKFLDEIQKVAEIPNPYLPDTEEKIGFVDVLLGLMKLKNVDLYVTGRNSRMLSTDILTEFRGRGDEIRVNPLSYSEFYTAFPGDKRDAWRDYFTFGGMPLILSQRTPEDKSHYLHMLFDKIYLDDIMARRNILMENIIYNELRARDYDVDVGVVTVNTHDQAGNGRRIQHEVDFVVNRAGARAYIQSAFAIPDEEKRAQETMSLRAIGDSFQKIVVVRDHITPWYDENGIYTVGVEDFLLDKKPLSI